MFAIVTNAFPFTHRALAYAYAVVYVIVVTIALVSFGFDLRELMRATRQACPIGMPPPPVCASALLVAGGLEGWILDPDFARFKSEATNHDSHLSDETQHSPSDAS